MKDHLHCTLCNETIEWFQLDQGDALVIEGEPWHTECFKEYFGDVALKNFVV